VTKHLERIFRLRTVLAFTASAFGTLFFSILLETFLFRPIAKSSDGLIPWNRELNALSLILASIIGGAVAVHLARSFSLWTLTKDEEAHPELLVLFAAAGAGTMVWLLRRIVADNPLTVGWRGIAMVTAGAATGGALFAGGRTRAIAAAALTITVVIGFGSVSYDYYTYPVAIPSGRVLLRGEVTVPGRSAEATYPGVLLVHDWGQQDREGTWGVSQPYREIAERLARSGYVVLRYDKRGSGASSGVFTQFGLEDFAQDVASAGAYLRALEEVRGQPTIAVGHGYGGQAVTIAARERPELFAAIALLNTPASSVADLLRAQERYALAAQGTSDVEIERRIAALDAWLDGVREREYVNYGDYFGSKGISDELQARQLAAPLPPAWVRQASAHDQIAALATVDVPVLVLTGDADWRVPPSEGEKLAQGLAAAGRTDWELRELAGVNHQLFSVADMATGFQLEQRDAYQEQRHPVSDAVLEALTEWLNRVRDDIHRNAG
jgi:pimeloyl-ACP methyl ester carboxylesterase